MGWPGRHISLNPVTSFRLCGQWTGRYWNKGGAAFAESNAISHFRPRQLSKFSWISLSKVILDLMKLNCWSISKEIVLQSQDAKLTIVRDFLISITILVYRSLYIYLDGGGYSLLVNWIFYKALVLSAEELVGPFGIQDLKAAVGTTRQVSDVSIRLICVCPSSAELQRECSIARVSTTRYKAEWIYLNRSSLLSFFTTCIDIYWIERVVDNEVHSTSICLYSSSFIWVIRLDWICFFCRLCRFKRGSNLFIPTSNSKVPIDC